MLGEVGKRRRLAVYNLALVIASWRPWRRGKTFMGSRPTSFPVLPGAVALLLAAFLLARGTSNACAYSFAGQTGAEARSGPPPAQPAANPRQLFQEAQQAQQRGDNALAVSKYQELLRFHPEIVAAHADLAVVLVSLGRYDEAISQYHF